MLDTKTFLTRVFAQQDELVVCVHKPDPTGEKPRGIFWNRGSFSSIDAAVAAIQRWDKEPDTTVYFGVGAFANHATTNPTTGRPKWTRRQDQATWFKALALDLDIGPDKPYATQREGWQAMQAALQGIGLPTPMVVSSGRGIHCYWPLTAPLSTAHWEKASIALRLALEEHKVVIDTSKVHDPSMVLRPVGTHHKKQTPWKPVACVADCPDYDPVSLITILKPWVGRAVARPNRPAGAARPQSSIAAAVLNTNDVVLDAVAAACPQIGALVATGGVLDAMGNAVAEPLWRVSLGLASRCTDVKDAIIRIAGQHPDFDLQASMEKAAGWRGTAPTCEKLAQLCPGGCDGCPHRGKIKSPATLTATTVVPVVSADGTDVVVELPDPYVVRDNKIWRRDDNGDGGVDANGIAVNSVEYDFISPYLMHISSFYKDPDSGKTTFRLAIKYPMSGWLEEDHDAGSIAAAGKEFSTFLLHRQVFGVKSIGQQEKLRSFLMDYLTMVQSQAPSGVDYVSFGWQEDGSFLCGETIIGSPSGHTARRLRGPAAEFADVLKPHGERDKWVDAMRMLSLPGTDTMRSAVLLSTAGILGPTAGNASMVVSIYSTETTTGKSLALIAANSLIGSPRELFMGKNDTANSTYKVRGVLNNLPCTIDELTSMADESVADLAYDLSQGQEKRALTKDRDLRKRAKWAGPTLVTTNISLHQKIESVQANNDPLKARVLELHQHDRQFVQTDITGSSHGYRFYDMVAENNGWAFPELVTAIVAAGGPKVIWAKGDAAFQRKFGFIFEPQERFYRTGIIAAWIMGKIGEQLGLFPFDVDGTIQHLLQHVVSFRRQALATAVDVFDTVGQFLQEHNDRLIEVIETVGAGKEQVKQPAPERAVARLKLVYDAQGMIAPGSQLAINHAYLKQWLAKTRDGVDRVARQLEAQGGLIAERDRVTLFKGCVGRNPGQAHCLIVNMNHPRFVAALTGTSARQQSPVLINVLQGQQA